MTCVSKTSNLGVRGSNPFRRAISFFGNRLSQFGCRRAARLAEQVAR
jgi:hypothetical protein